MIEFGCRIRTKESADAVFMALTDYAHNISLSDEQYWSPPEAQPINPLSAVLYEYEIHSTTPP